MAKKQWLEIGMLLAQDPKLFRWWMKPGPSGMTDEETHKTGELLLSLEGKYSIVVIEHDMKCRSCGRLRGKVTVAGGIEARKAVRRHRMEVQSDELVIEALFGT